MTASPASAADQHPSESIQGPKHVAIIMDGNGRWAKARGLPRSIGHERGVEALRRTVEAAPDFGIQYLTLYSFSTENWRRPVAEVNALLNLLRSYVRKDLSRLHAEGVKIRMIGSRKGLPDDIADLIVKAESQTKSNDKFFMTIAFNYGGRDEIVRAAVKLADRARQGQLDPAGIDETVFEGALDTFGLPDPELLIRTSGEYRVSNFLPWQLTYTEMVFMDVLWPDFGREKLAEAVATYARRERRFGAVDPGAK